MSGVPGMPLPSWSPDLKPCGTPAAYRRHLRRGEPVDESCRQAMTREWQERVASGWERAPRPRDPARVHLPGAGQPSLCGRARSTSAVTEVLGDVTCANCVAVLARHQDNEQAKAAA